MSDLPTYAELYVVSDIHLGGRRDDRENFQIFNRGERLGALIRHVAAQRADQDVALVLNGDVIDSLAEDGVPGYVALDAGTATAMLKHIFTDDSFRPVWEALGKFVTTARRHLVFVLGNHDIELSLPLVEDAIRRRLAEDDGDARSRIHFATHGGGYACRVAEADVFCTHGNEVDDWNCVDYNQLGQLANALNAGRAVERSKWKPNAGTRLVVDVMNHVKRRHPFVDVLKPETAAVAGVLLALDKDIFKGIDLEDAFPILRDKVRGGLVTRRLLGAEATTLSAVPVGAVAEETAAQLLGPSLREAVSEKRSTTGHASEDDLLLAAEGPLTGRKGAEAIIEVQGTPETLGVWDIVSGWVGLVPKPEALRRALDDWLKDDQTFEVDNRDDDLFAAMQDRVGDGVDFVVTGHTHKPRALKMKRNGYYYNCGTWIRTLRLSQEALGDREAFERDVWPALNSRRLDDLDAVRIPGPNGSAVPLLFDRTNVVRISAQSGRAVGELLRVTDGEAAGSVVLEVEPGTTPFVVG